MSSKLIVPFNFQPFSVSVKTGAYTIPAGYYAHVSAHCDLADTFSIGGVVALQGNGATAQSITTAAVSAVSNSAIGVVNYTVPSGYYFTGQCSTSSSSAPTVTIGGLGAGVGNGQTSTPQTFYAGSGDVVSAQATLNTCIVTGVSIRPFSITTMALQGTNVSGNFWVGTGIALTTSGGRYTVTLYPNIS